MTAVPLVSVIVPTFDRPRQVQRALDSVLAQTLTEFEAIVVDDGSTTTPALPDRMATDPRIRLLVRNRNGGAAAARNDGASHARAPLLAFLDDDDEFLPHHLATTVEAWEQARPGVGLTWTGVSRVFGNRTVDQEPPQDGSCPAAVVVSIGAGFGTAIPTWLFRRMGGFDTRLRTLEDADLFLRLLEAERTPQAIPGVGVRVHEHAGPRLTDKDHARLRRRECAVLLTRHREYLSDHPEVGRMIRRHTGPSSRHFPWCGEDR